MDKQDYLTTLKILDRAISEDIITPSLKAGLMMDLEFVNDIIPLDLEKLLNFDVFDLHHDIVGIYQNFNRKSKEMKNLFVPRCAK